MSVLVLETLAVTAELCGTTFSEPAVRAMVRHLAAHPESEVLKALERCQKEVKGKLTLADIIGRIDDGRPGAEAAWALVPRSERDTAVLTREMQMALAAVGSLIEDDPIPARMAFKEAYDKAVREARSANKPVEWAISLGWDAGGREGPVLEALRLGRISEADAVGAISYTETGRTALESHKAEQLSRMTTAAIRKVA